jgi:hypothetical protein
MFDRETISFKEKFDRPSSLPEAFDWANELDIDEDFAYSKDYDFSIYTIKMLLMATGDVIEPKVAFRPNGFKIYQEFNVKLERPNSLNTPMVVDEAIPLQQQQHFDYALEYGIVFGSPDVVNDLLHQLDKLDKLDTHYEQIVDYFKKRIETFYYATLTVNPWILSENKLFMQFMKQASKLIENDVSNFQDREVALLTIGTLKEQSDFDEFVDSMSQFAVQRLQDKLLKLLELPMIEDTMLLYRMSSNPATFEVLKEAVKDLITYDANGKERVSQWRDKVNQSFKTWLLKEGYIRPEV